MIAELLCVVCALYKQDNPLTQRFDEWMRKWRTNALRDQRNYGTIKYRWLISAFSLLGLISSMFLFVESVYWARVAPCGRWDFVLVSLIAAIVCGTLHWHVLTFLWGLRQKKLHIDVANLAVTRSSRLRLSPARLYFICFTPEVVTKEVVEYLHEQKDFYRGWAETYDWVIASVGELMNVKILVKILGPVLVSVVWKCLW